MIIPQASLSGKVKGKTLQYHSLKEKEAGRILFEQLKENLEKVNL